VAERTYRGRGVDVVYDPARCRHVAACVRGLPTVFDTARRPWIDPDGEPDPARVAEVVERCPTGALHHRRHDGVPEAPTAPTTVTALPDGPLLLRGDLRVEVDGVEVAETRAALCRCGRSAVKPWCDGSHERTGWRSG